MVVHVKLAHDMYALADPDKFHNNLTSDFQKLALAGGFELLCQGSKKTLELIPPPSKVYSVEYQGLSSQMQNFMLD